MNDNKLKISIKMSKYRWLSLASLALTVNSVQCLNSNDLFPFGPPAGDSRLAADAEDVSSPEVDLGTTVKFFGREYSTIYVSEEIICIRRSIFGRMFCSRTTFKNIEDTICLHSVQREENIGHACLLRE